MRKIQRYLMIGGAAIMAALFFIVKFIAIGKKVARTEMLEAQREIENEVTDNLKQEVKQSNANTERNENKITRSDYSGFNDS